MKKRFFTYLLLSHCIFISLCPTWAVETDPSGSNENQVSTEMYLADYKDGFVTIYNNSQSLVFDVPADTVFYSLYDTRTFNLVFDQTGRIYINEHSGDFVVDSVECIIDDDAFMFRFYDADGNWIQEEHSDGCGGTTPYGCYLANSSEGYIMKSCYHDDSESEEPADTLDYYSVDSENHQITFDTSLGPLFCIDYLTQEILSCTSENAEILKCEIADNFLTLTVSSTELPGEHTYIFDLTQNMEAISIRIDRYEDIAEAFIHCPNPVEWGFISAADSEPALDTPGRNRIVYMALSSSSSFSLDISSLKNQTVRAYLCYEDENGITTLYSDALSL